MNSVFAQAALIYSQRFDLAVFPCKPRDKTPLTPHGVKDAVKDHAQIEAWWTRWPEANVAIACGEVSGGLFVLDVDGPGGEDSLRKLESNHGVCGNTPWL